MVPMMASALVLSFFFPFPKPPLRFCETSLDEDGVDMLATFFSFKDSSAPGRDTSGLTMGIPWNSEVYDRK